MKFDVVTRKLGIVSSGLAYVGCIALFAMMCLTTADVVGRYLFNRPITGAFEITEYLVLILIFAFIGYSQAQKSHVAVDLLWTQLPPRMRVYVDLGNHLACLALMVLITWMGGLKATELKTVGEASPNLQIPAYPFAFFMVLGCMVMCIELLRDVLQLIGGMEGSEDR